MRQMTGRRGDLSPVHVAGPADRGLRPVVSRGSPEHALRGKLAGRNVIFRNLQVPSAAGGKSALRSPVFHDRHALARSISPPGDRSVRKREVVRQIAATPHGGLDLRRAMRSGSGGPPPRTPARRAHCRDPQRFATPSRPASLAHRARRRSRPPALSASPFDGRRRPGPRQTLGGGHGVFGRAGAADGPGSAARPGSAAGRVGGRPALA
jgi:hypothetical protein